MLECVHATTVPSAQNDIYELAPTRQSTSAHPKLYLKLTISWTDKPTVVTLESVSHSDHHN